MVSHTFINTQLRMLERILRVRLKAYTMMMMMRRIGGGTSLRNAQQVPNKKFSSSPQPRRLEGKVAMITGGCGGIGKATAELFSTEGAKLIIVDVIKDEGKGHKIAHSLGARYIHCDVRKEEDVSKAVDATISAYGKLDIMYNNAGIVGETTSYSITETNMEDFDRVMDVNVKGALLGTKYAALAMIRHGTKGSIIFTSSIAAIIAGNGTHNYTISKHALLGIMQTSTSELRQHGIRVNSISPYVIPTPLTFNYFKQIAPTMENHNIEAKLNEKCGFQGVKWHPDDIARAALFLASDDSRYVSGHNLVVDGGFTMHKFLNLLSLS